MFTDVTEQDCTSRVGCFFNKIKAQLKQAHCSKCIWFGVSACTTKLFHQTFGKVLVGDMGKTKSMYWCTLSNESCSSLPQTSGNAFCDVKEEVWSMNSKWYHWVYALSQELPVCNWESTQVLEPNSQGKKCGSINNSMTSLLGRKRTQWKKNLYSLNFKKV